MTSERDLSHLTPKIWETWNSEPSTNPLVKLHFLITHSVPVISSRLKESRMLFRVVFALPYLPLNLSFSVICSVILHSCISYVCIYNTQLYACSEEKLPCAPRPMNRKISAIPCNISDLSKTWSFTRQMDSLCLQELTS